MSNKKTKNKKLNETNKKEKLAFHEKSYITFQYIPMFLALGMISGLIIGEPVNGVLIGSVIGFSIDYSTSMYKKKHMNKNKK